MTERSAGTTSRARRWRWLGAGAVLAIVAVMAVAAMDVAVGSAWHPIQRGPVFWSPIGFDEDCDPSDEEVGCRHYPFAAGGTLTFGGSISNDGPLPITILGGPRDETALVAEHHRRLLTSEPGVTLEGAYPFAPFVLQPGEFRMIVEDRVLRCPPMGGLDDEGRGMSSYDSITVRYRLLVREHEVVVPLANEVFIDYPNRTECPAP